MHLKIHEDGNQTRLIGLSVSNFSQKQEYEGLPFHSLSILAHHCNFTMLPLFLDSAIKSSLWRDCPTSGNQHLLIAKQEHRRDRVRKLLRGEEAGAGSSCDDGEDSCCDITTP